MIQFSELDGDNIFPLKASIKSLLGPENYITRKLAFSLNFQQSLISLLHLIQLETTTLFQTKVRMVEKYQTHKEAFINIKDKA